MIRGRFLTSRDDISQVIALRREVFCEEQGYSVDTEPDAHDDMAVYALAFDDEGRPLGTGRLYIADDQFRIGRVCVKKEMRGMHRGFYHAHAALPGSAAPRRIRDTERSGG